MQNQVGLTTMAAATATEYKCQSYLMTKKFSSAFGLTVVVLFLGIFNANCVEANISDATSFDGASQQPPTATAATVKGKLVFSQVIYRHGDRTPIETYPTDPWNKREDWPVGWGELTNIGKLQQYHLGKWLRQRYSTLLSEIYDENEIYVRSTDVDRTLASALSNLAGLYEPKGKDIWNPSINWQPIPVHTWPENMDEVLAAKAACPVYEYAYSAMLDTDEFHRLNDRYAYLYEYLTKYTGKTIDSLEALQRINNTLFIEELYNKTLPEWTHKIYPSEDMTNVAKFTFAMATYTRQLARLKMGPLIKEILERFVAKSKGKLNPDRSVWIYSAHDTTVASVLNTLKLYDIHSPPYAACIMLEMRLDDKKQPFISIFYKNTTAEPLPMYIPGCGTECPIKKMFDIYNDILPQDWEEECKLSTLMMTYEEANIGTAMAVLVAIITIMLFLSYVVMVYYRRRSYRNYFSYSQPHKLDA